MTYKDNRPSKIFDSQEGYDKYAKFYDQKLEHLNSFEVGAMDKVLGDIEGKNILDVGCGTGRLIKKLKDRGAIVTGVDISNEMLNIAKDKHHGVSFTVGDIEHLPFKDDTFDMVIASFVIVHLKYLKEAFDEVYRVLKPGGSFVVTNINQRKAPKLKISNKEEIVITSFYHIPDHVISSLEDALFNIEDEEFVNENGIWINQIVKAVKV